jgi:DUF1009 family protein
LPQPEALLEFEVDFLECVGFHFVGQEDFLHAFHFDQRLGVGHCLSFNAGF